MANTIVDSFHALVEKPLILKHNNHLLPNCIPIPIIFFGWDINYEKPPTYSTTPIINYLFCLKKISTPGLIYITESCNVESSMLGNPPIKNNEYYFIFPKFFLLLGMQKCFISDTVFYVLENKCCGAQLLSW